MYSYKPLAFRSDNISMECIHEQPILLTEEDCYTASYSCKYCNLPSKRPFLCKCPPPIFDDPMIFECMHYTYKWVSAHPRFWPVNFKRPWVLTRENMVGNSFRLHKIRMIKSASFNPEGSSLGQYSKQSTCLLA